MAQKQAIPVQEQAGDAQALSLTREAAARLMASRMERRGTELTGVTVVLALGEGRYLKSKLPGETVEALKQALLAIPRAERPDFLGIWMGRAQDAMYDAYARATAAGPAATFFSYTIPPFEAPPQPAAQPTPFRAAVPAKPVFIQSEVRLPGTTMAKAPARVELPRLPEGVKGKGTRDDQYLIDLTGKAPDEGPQMDLVMPVNYSIVGLGTAVYVKYKLRPSQVKEIIKNRSSPASVELRSMTSKAIERYGAERGVSGETLQDFTFSIEGAMRDLPRRIGALVRQTDNAELRKYLSLQ